MGRARGTSPATATAPGVVARRGPNTATAPTRHSADVANADIQGALDTLAGAPLTPAAEPLLAATADAFVRDILDRDPMELRDFLHVTGWRTRHANTIALAADGQLHLLDAAHIDETIQEPVTAMCGIELAEHDGDEMAGRGDWNNPSLRRCADCERRAGEYDAAEELPELLERPGGPLTGSQDELAFSARAREYATGALRRCLAANGADRDAAQRAAQEAVSDALAHTLVDRHRREDLLYDTMPRHDRVKLLDLVDELSGPDVPPAELAARPRQLLSDQDIRGLLAQWSQPELRRGARSTRMLRHRFNEQLLSTLMARARERFGPPT